MAKSDRRENKPKTEEKDTTTSNQSTLLKSPFDLTQIEYLICDSRGGLK